MVYRCWLPPRNRRQTGLPHPCQHFDECWRSLYSSCAYRIDEYSLLSPYISRDSGARQEKLRIAVPWRCFDSTRLPCERVSFPNGAVSLPQYFVRRSEHETELSRRVIQCKCFFEQGVEAWGEMFYQGSRDVLFVQKRAVLIGTDYATFECSAYSMQFPKKLMNSAGLPLN